MNSTGLRTCLSDSAIRAIIYYYITAQKLIVDLKKITEVSPAFAKPVDFHYRKEEITCFFLYRNFSHCRLSGRYIPTCGQIAELLISFLYYFVSNHHLEIDFQLRVQNFSLLRIASSCQHKYHQLPNCFVKFH